MPMEESLKAPACERCHRRKSRCDKARPSCTSCMKAKASCVYDWRDPVVRRTDIEQLERRLRQSEAKNAALSSQLNDARRSVVRENVSRPASEYAAETHSHARANAQRATHDLGHLQVDRHRQASFLPTSSNRDKQFLGSASGLLLADLLQVKETADNTNEIDAESPTGRRFGGDYRREGNIVMPEASALPSRDLSRSLMSAYLSHDYLSYPCLHPQTLIDAFDAAYTEEGFYKTKFFDAFTIDMVLAIGTARVSKFDWQGLPDSETHHDRAMSRLSVVMSLGSTNALQAILLTCQYRMLSASRDSSTSLWHLVGTAARICLELGLHRESVYHDTQGLISNPDGCVEQDAELNRRCFWCVVALDRLVSITLGRPLALHIEDIDTELPRALGGDVVISDSPLRSMDRSDGSRLWQSTGCFVHIVRYRIICGKILNCLHNATRKAAHGRDDIHAVRRSLAEELEEWRHGIDTLPLYDSTSLNDQERSCLESRDWYSLLYHNAVLMLYRPSHTSHDLPPDGHALWSIFDSARQSIKNYSSLHRSRRVNYSWITLQAVFIAGLSYIYAVRMHFQTRRQQLKPLVGNKHVEHAACLPVDPSITEIVSDTRACSIVLVAVSERWSSAWNRHVVFGRLSDAVLADAVDFLTNTISANALSRASTNHQELNISQFPSAPIPLVNQQNVALQAGSEMMPDMYQYCFEGLPYFEQDYLGTTTIDLASQDWLSEIQGLNGVA